MFIGGCRWWSRLRKFSKKIFWRHFGVFETLRKNRSEDFFKILPKCAKKKYLLHRTIFSPVKHKFLPFLAVLAVFGRFFFHLMSTFRKFWRQKKKFNFFFNFFFLNAKKITESEFLFIFTYDVTGDVRLIKFNFLFVWDFEKKPFR